MRKLLVLFMFFIPLACFSADSRNTSASTTFEFQAIKSFASPDTPDWSYSIEVVNRYGKSNDGVYSGEIIASEVERDIPVTDEKLIAEYEKSNTDEPESDIGKKITEHITGISKQRKLLEKAVKNISDIHARTLLKQSLETSGS